MKCALCHKKKPLMNSHIIPEHVYSPTYGEKHRCIGIESDGKPKFIQKGLREKLLCNDCEQLLSKEYEDYFAKFWIAGKAISNPVLENSIIIENIDYLKFKLYHLSILFRASVSDLPTFSDTHIGKHEEIIRKMLLNGSDNRNYNVFGSVLIDDKNVNENRIIIAPKRKRYGLHTVYETIYAGCAWYIKISSHKSKEIESISLKEDGRLQLVVNRWENFRTIQEIHNTLISRKS